jgi:hypothetical protein
MRAAIVFLCLGLCVVFAQPGKQSVLTKFITRVQCLLFLKKIHRTFLREYTALS